MGTRPSWRDRPFRHPGPNRYDILFAERAKALEALKKTGFLFTDKKALGEIFLSISGIRYELDGLLERYRDYLIPAMKKLGKLKFDEASDSRSENLLDALAYSQEDVEEVVRLGYTDLWNKYEGFKGKLIDRVDALLPNEQENTAAFILRVYKDNIKKAHILHPTLDEVDWVNNSVKHKGGEPIKRREKSAVPSRFQHAPLDKRIRITPEELYKDIEAIRDFTPHLVRALVAVTDWRSIERQMKDPLYGHYPVGEKNRLKSNLDKSIDLANQLIREMLSHQPSVRKAGKPTDQP